MSLTNYEHPKAKELKEYLETTGLGDFRLGKGIIVTGPTQEGYDIAILAARALIMQGFDKLHCWSFSYALENLDQLYLDKPPLLITNFHAATGIVDITQFKRLENILSHYLDNGTSVSIHSPYEDLGDLVNPVLLDRLQKRNKKFSL
jgi:hypothetical protein